MTDEQTFQITGAQRRREDVVSRYQVDVGEEFPLSEKEKRACSRYEAPCEGGWDAHEWHEHEWHGREWQGHEWRGGYRVPRLLMLFAAIAVGVALISTASSYPLATLAIAAIALLFAGGYFRGGHRRTHGRRDAA